MFSHSFNSELVRPLRSAENQFLQVLVDCFVIRRKGAGFELQVEFDEQSPCIWLRDAKRHILSTLPTNRRVQVQNELCAFYESDAEEYRYHDSGFPFRLGNGGTLPIVRLKGADYYCLFYRDSHPTGWNIANGGANTQHEILHPDLIVERELREELIVVEPEGGRWYVFDWHDARLCDHPDFAVAQQLWEEQFRKQGFPQLKKTPLPLKWSIPPDAKLPEECGCYYDAMRIRRGSEFKYTGQGFLNLNAEDFGIEFDRIAKLAVGPETVFCDGELRNGSLLNRVVGLFAVERVQKSVARGEARFLPERIYWGGVDRTGDDPEAVVELFLKGRGSSRAMLEENLRRHSAPDHPRDAFDLCPATRTIVARHRRLREAEKARVPAEVRAKEYEVFVSFASEDRDMAREVFERVEGAARRAFFSDISITCGGFADQIDEALDSATAFVAVASKAEHLRKSWVKYEWRNFSNDVNGGRKPENSPFFAFVTGVDPEDLPRPLRLRQPIRVDNSNPKQAFEKLTQFIAMP